MTTKVLRAVATYEMLASILSFTTFVLIVASGATRSLSLAAWLLVTVLLSLAGASFVAGVGLWKSIAWARRLSMILQALQVPRFALSGVAQYGVALALSIELNMGAQPASLRSPLHLVLGFADQAQGVYLGVNALALLALIVVARWRPGTTVAPQTTAVAG